MKDKILAYIIEQFGEDELVDKQDRQKHYSYCSAPFEECTCRNLSDIGYDTSLINGGYIDSFSMVGVWHWLEQTFSVKIPDRHATPNNFDSVNKMVELVNQFKK